MLGVNRHRGAAVDGSAFLGQTRDRLGLRPRSWGEDGGEAAPHVRQRDAVLRPLRPGHARLHLAQVELEQLGELRRRRAVDPEKALLFRIALDQLDLLAVATGHLQVAQRLLVHREKRRGRPVLGAHVAEGRAVGHGEARQAVAAELDELVDDAVLAQHLCEGQHEVGRGGAGAQGADETDADHDGRGEVGGLAQDRGLGLDAACAPAQHAEAVDHRRVGVGAHEGVGDRHPASFDVAHLHDPGEVFEVHLVADAHAGRHQREVVKRLLRPAQQRVALAVAFDLLLDVARVGVAKPERVDLHRMVDDQVDGHERVDLACVLARALHRRAHGRQVYDGRHAGEVLHQDTCRQERQLGSGRGQRGPVREDPDVRLGCDPGFGEPHQAFEEDFDGDRKAGGVLDSCSGEVVQGIELEVGALQLRPLDHCWKRYRVSTSVLEQPPNSSLTGIGAGTRFR